MDNGLNTVTIPDIDWVKTYEKMGIKLQADIPQDPSRWVMPVSRHVTCSKIIKAFKNAGVLVSGRGTNDLDAIVLNDRDHRKSSYFVSFRKTIEADPEMGSKSLNDIIREGIKGNTVLERLLLGFGYFMTTEGHLDIIDKTFCTGSRFKNGFIPGVHTISEHQLLVGWYINKPKYVRPHLRTRAAMSH